MRLLRSCVVLFLSQGKQDLWCSSGDNVNGQATVPSILAKYHAVSAGPRHTCALSASGNLNQPSLGGSTVRCFGAVAGAVPSGKLVTAVAAGGGHTCVLSAADGTPVCFGNDAHGQAAVPLESHYDATHRLDDREAGTRVGRSGYQALNTRKVRLSAVCAGDFHTCGVSLNVATRGQVLCWPVSPSFAFPSPNPIDLRVRSIAQWVSPLVESN